MLDQRGQLLRAALVWGACLLLLGGCSSSSSPRVVDLDTEGQIYGFLVDGTTTAAEVRSRLGNPDSEFEQSRIVTYRPTGYYELVLVFDGNQVLKRHALIERYRR